MSKSHTIVKFQLSFLPLLCFVGFSIAVVMVTISLNSSVMWNTYEENYFFLKIYFSHSLWTHLDKSVVEGNKNGHETYLTILKNNFSEIDAFKSPVIDNLYRATGTTGAAVLCLLVGISATPLTQQKLVIVILEFLAVVLGITGGYFTLSAKTAFKDGIIQSLDPHAANTYFFPEKIQLKVGYELASYGGIISITASILLLLSLLLYIWCGEGKWPWQKHLSVTPGRRAWDTQHNGLWQVGNVQTGNFNPAYQ